jgi:aryl-alcohol dehydrogenase-like predicted oxidoreductase
MTTKTHLSEEEVPTAETQLTLGSGEKAIQVPPMGVGLWAWGDSSVWGYKSYDQSLGDESMKEAFHASTQSGVNFFDTAEVYGRGLSEQFLGKFMKESDGTTKYIVATKFFPNPLYFSYPSVLLDHLKESLKRLQLDSVDLYQIHGPIHLRSVEVVGEALADAVDAGLVKAVGVSNYSISQMQRMHATLKKRGIQLASNQVEFSIVHRLPETSGLIAEAHKLGVGILAYCPLGMGRLTGKYDSKNPPPGSRRFANYSMERLDPLIKQLRELGSKYNKSPAQIALNWCICKGTIPIPGAKNAKQATDNAGALGFRLTKEELTSLDKLGEIGSTNIWQHG